MLQNVFNAVPNNDAQLEPLYELEDIIYYIEKLHYICISRCCKMAKKLTVKREMYALLHLNLSAASFKCLT